MGFNWVPLAASVIGGYLSNKSGKRNIRASQKEADRAFQEQQRQQLLLAEQMDQYKTQSFVNPYAENVFEDLTVNQKQAQFQTQQGNQQRADLLQNLKGAAGGSGIASLAQTLANQGQLANQRISIGIGQQESANQRLLAQGKLKGQAGDEMVQNKYADLQSTLLGVQFGQATGANQSLQQTKANVLGAKQSATAGNRSSMQALTNTLLDTDLDKLFT